jgi:hypothetical protein
MVFEQERREAYRITEHDKKDTGNLRVERAGMTYLATQHFSYPCRNLMA